MELVLIIFQNMMQYWPVFDIAFAVAGLIASSYTFYRAGIWLKREIKYQTASEYDKAFANSTGSFWYGEPRSSNIF